LPVYAVGEATAEAAREVGFDVAGSGEGGVERLLGSIPPDLRLLHLCGEHRIQVKAAQAITVIPVYWSRALPAPEGLREIEGQVAAVHSPRAGQRLAELAGEAGIDRATVRIAAISAAAASAAGSGWESCEAADTPDEAALLALAARLCDNRPET
jgi:uroporphyrinogen-III synthase